MPSFRRPCQRSIPSMRICSTSICRRRQSLITTTMAATTTTTCTATARKRSTRSCSLLTLSLRQSRLLPISLMALRTHHTASTVNSRLSISCRTSKCSTRKLPATRQAHRAMQMPRDPTGICRTPRALPPLKRYLWFPARRRKREGARAIANLHLRARKPQEFWRTCKKMTQIARRAERKAVTRMKTMMKKRVLTMTTPRPRSMARTTRAKPRRRGCEFRAATTYMREVVPSTHIHALSLEPSHRAEKRRRRRESHNAVERRRRDNINEKISERKSLRAASGAQAHLLTYRLLGYPVATLLPEAMLLDAIA